MARKRLSRKELVQKDEITTTLETTTAFLLERKRPILMVTAVVVALGLVFVGWNIYAANRESSSQSALSAAIATFSEVTRFDTDQERFTAALAEAQTVRDAYPTHRAGQIAEYYVALSHGGLGNTAESIRLLQEIVDTGDETIQQVARYALAESHKASGELDMAIAVLMDLVDTGGYAQGAVLLELGRLHESLSQTEKARSYYQLIVGDHPGSPFREDADRALDRLGTGEITDEETES